MAEAQNGNSFIIVGLASCGIAAGAADVFTALDKKIKEKNLNITLKRTGCIGACYKEPLIEIHTAGLPTVIYGDVTVKKLDRILQEHLQEQGAQLQEGTLQEGFD